MRGSWALVLWATALFGAGPGEWPQWGGPNRNFTSPAKGLAASWPAAGPKLLWKRVLGEGYSAITVSRGALYTMYRQGNDEIVVAADAATGKTLWEHRYAAPIQPGMGMENGRGPHSTPLVAGDRVFTAGILAQLHCLDRKTGKLLWSRDLYKDFGGTLMGRGYACSPLAYRDLVIVQAGGQGQAVIALGQEDGAVHWKGGEFPNSPSSPLLIDVGGLEQLVVFASDRVAGFNPLNGHRQWSHAHATQWGLNISTPVWGPDGLLFCSSAYNGGSRMLELSRRGTGVEVKELWATNRMRLHHGNAVRIGDYLYGSSGDFGPAPLTAIEARTGKIAWQSREFPKANFVHADGKVIVLDEDGNLALATFTPKGVTVHSKVQLLSHNAWTAPSLAGTTLYVRDRRAMMALDLK